MSELIPYEIVSEFNQQNHEKDDRPHRLSRAKTYHCMHGNRQFKQIATATSTTAAGSKKAPKWLGNDLSAYRQMLPRELSSGAVATT